jgi:hypothetical protein
MAAKTTLGWPLLVAATSINCIRRLDVIPAKSWSWRRVPKGRSPALMRGEAEPRRPPQSADRDGLLWQVRPGWSVPKERDPASLWKGSDEAAQANAHFG